MNKIILASLFTLTTSLSYAFNFEGTYKLMTSKENGKAFCFKGLSIHLKEQNELFIFRTDSPSDAIYKTILNGELEYKGSHGEAMTTYSGITTSKHSGNLLVVTDKVKVKAFGIPAGTEIDQLTMKLVSDKSLHVERLTKEPFLEGGKTDIAKCIYEKE